MENQHDAKLLRIFISESDRIGHQPLYERIVFEAKKSGLAGATVLRGIMGYGANSQIHSTKLFDISTELPLVVEIVDDEEKIREFAALLETLFGQSIAGGMITIEKAEVIMYKPGQH